MFKIFMSTKSNEGYTIIAAMLILVILSLIGVSATNNASMESQITANSQVQKMAFYVADSGWQVAADFLDDQFPMVTANVGTSETSVIDMASTSYDNPVPYKISTNKQFSATARFDGAEIAPLWDVDLFRAFTYTINSTGEYVGYGTNNPRNADSEITVSAGKIVQTGG